jgi:WD40 repeat protein/serine/threonine protein kinase
MIDGPSGSSDRDRQVNEIITAYLQAVDAGQTPDRQEWLRQYPEFAAELQAFLADYERVDRMAEPLRPAAPSERAVPGDAATMDSARPPAAGTGTTIRYFGDYELLEEIGRGGMGVVYKARQVSLNRVVALKMILAGQLATESDVKRFHTEAEAAAQLDHPGIVPIFEVGQHEGQHYFSMGYVEGQSLAAKVAEGPLAPRAAAALVRSVAEAVQYAHQKGVIHRDLKPSNIMLAEEGEERRAESRKQEQTDSPDSRGFPPSALRSRPRITDFGLAKRVAADAGPTTTGQILGTPSYMPPEQAAGKRDEVGPASDVYGLGAVLYTLVTGRPPFQSANPLDTLRQVREAEPAAPRLLNPGIDRDLETIILKCLAKEPAGRYATAQELADDLARFLGGQPIHARPVGRGQRLWRWCRRNPVVASLTAAVVISLMLGTGIATYFALEARREAAHAREKEGLAEAKAREAEDNLALARSRLYISDMRLTQRAWQEGQFERFDELLDEQRPEQTGGTDYRGFEWYYWQRVRHGELCVLEGHRASVTCVAFSADGKRLASGGRDQTVKIWDVVTGREVRTIDAKVKVESPQADEVTSLAFSPDGTRLAGVCRGIGKVWDTASGQETLSLKAERKRTEDDDYEVKLGVLVFSPDGKQLAAATHKSADGMPSEILVWDAATGRLAQKLKGHGDWVTCLTFTPDGKQVLSGGWDHAIRIWDAADGHQIRVIKADQGWLQSLAISRDGTRIASGGEHGTVKVWDAAKGTNVAELKGHTGYVNSLAFRRDGRQLVSTSGGDDGSPGRVIVGEPGARALITLPLPPHDMDCRSALSPDGRRLATPWGTSVKLWDMTSPAAEVICHGHSGAVNRLAFLRDDTRVASASRDGTIRIWDPATGAEVARLGREGISSESTVEVESLVCSPDGGWLAGAHNADVILWDPRSGQQLFTFRAHEDVVQDDGRERPRGISELSVSPDGKWLATVAAGERGEIRLWRVSGLSLRSTPSDPASKERGPQPEHALKADDSFVTAVTFSPDSTRLASNWEGTVRFWEVESGRELPGFECEGAVAHGTFSPDGKLLAAADEDGTVGLWALESGTGPVSRNGLEGASQKPGLSPFPTARLLQALRGHTAQVRGLAFSPDGKRLASGSGAINAAGELIVWDVARGEEVLSLKFTNEPVTAVAFSQDGQRLAAGVGRPGTRSFSDHPLPGHDVHLLDIRPLTETIRQEREAASVYRAAVEAALLKEEVLEFIRQDATISDAVRQQALTFADHYRPESYRLRAAAWAVVCRPDATVEACRRALHCAELAERQEPNRCEFLGALGAAQYRAGQYPQAVATLTTVADMRPQSWGQIYALHPLFLAMARSQAGQKAEAEAALQKYRETSAGMGYGEESKILLREAEKVVEGK